ncbi:MAG: BamA/TamA family outer membrane protein [Alistipes sp.]|nr:BamA/TamA family outer membrane protein [Alistipes sp.]MDY5199213.1 BamA/TamA family outer membrane protein [Candidatus Cryptobacteroides sp.]
MRKKPSFCLFAATVMATAVLSFSCSTTRVLGDGQFRLADNKVVVDNDRKFNTKEIESYIKQKPNSYIIFGWNPFLNIYNWSGKNADKGINKFLRKIGTAPVVYQPSQVEASVENINRHLEYLGYYGSDVRSEVRVNGKRVTVTYSVTLGRRYRIGNVSFAVPDGEFKEDFYADTAAVSIRPGDFLSEDALEKETERAASMFRRKGYFGFTKNYFSFEADTLARRDTADLLMTVKEYTRNQTAEYARPHRKYFFGDVSISYDNDLKFNDRVLKNICTIRPGAMYDEREVNTTYSRLSALRLFSGVNVALNPRDSGIVDCDISLTKSRMQGFKVNLEGSTNSTGLIGISPQVSYYHKNIFHGGQWLNLGFLGNFQFKYDDRSVKSNEFGVSAGLSFPEFLGLPNSIFHGPSVPRTEINASYNYQNRPEYTRNMISTSYGYSGSLRNGKFFYQFYPIQAKIVRLTNLDPNFYTTLSGNPFMRDAYQNHFDVGSGLVAYYTTSTALVPKETYEYARLQLDASGNVLSLFNKAMKSDEYGSRLIWNTPYSQYIRTELTLGKTFVFGKNGGQALAIRLLGGVGYAYGNSSTIPFEKQFYSGGANSMRGWQARSLGPGNSKADTTFVIPSQTGDVKLEANLEYRFPMFWKLCGAVFTDVGNIWTLKETDGDDGSHTHFDLKNLAASLAADWGIGLRVDLNFLILRLDMGMKVYDPSLDTARWRSPSQWLKKDGYTLHFGVGYPF